MERRVESGVHRDESAGMCGGFCWDGRMVMSG